LSNDEHRKARSRGLKLAALTSLVCKGGNILLQLIAIPIALTVLGKEEFGVFETISALITFVILSEFGIGPGLTNLLAKKKAEEDSEGQGVAFSSAFILVSILAALGCAGMMTVVWMVPVETLFGSGFAAYADPMRQAITLGIGIIFIKMLTSLGERARAAYQETFVNNLYGAIGNVTAGLTLIIGIQFIPKIWFLILAVNGCAALVGIANLIHLWIVHPHLVPKLRRFQSDVAKFLFQDGLAFCATMNLAPIAKDLGLRLVLGHIGGPAVVAVFGILERIVVFIYGFVVMFTLPLWPALSDASARRDLPWIRTARSRLYIAALLYGVALTAGLSLLGPWAIDIWLKQSITVSHTVMFTFGIYLAFAIWQHVNHIFLAGLDAIRSVSAVVLAELPFFLLGGYLGYQAADLPGMYIGITIAGLISTILLPIIARQRMQSLARDLESTPPEEVILAA